MTTLKELRERMENYAKEKGYKLNPKLLKPLLANEKEYGELYCPCRRVTGNKRKDRKIICPCKYHKKEIKKDGHCYCGLFVRDEFLQEE